MKPRAIVFAIAATQLLACTQKQHIETSAEGATIAAAPIDVAAIDEFAPNVGALSGLVLWAHPAVPFNGLMIAAGDAGVAALNIEDGTEIARSEGFAATGAALAYLGDGAQAQAYLAVSAAGGGQGAWRFYSIDNASRGLTLLTSAFIDDPKTSDGFCLGRAPGEDRLMLHQMFPTGWKSTPLQVRDGIITADTPSDGAVDGGLIKCIADPADGSMLAVAANGDLHRIRPGDSKAPTFLVATNILNARAIGVAVNAAPGDDTPTKEPCCGQIGLLDGAGASVHLFDRTDGHALGAVRLISSFDVAGVEAASIFAFEAGNFGGVYRDGLIALGVEGEDAKIRLASFNSVSDALRLSIGPTFDRRAIHAEPEEDDPRVIDIELVRP